jgi:hypothetical protein
MRLILMSAALFAATPAAATIVVDGSVDAGYGAATATVATDAAAPTGNFGTPGPTATAGYNIYLTDMDSNLYGAIQQTGGDAVGAFANVYFDLNPTVGDGSDLGFEIGSSGVTAFIPGKNGDPGFSTVLDPSLFGFASVTSGGLTTVEFSLSNSLFTQAIAGLAYYDGQTFEPTVDLRLSQSLSYSVAGGDTYGPARLGAIAVGSAVPEPATWAMMLFGFGAVGFSMRRSRKNKTVLQQSA